MAKTALRTLLALIAAALMPLAAVMALAAAPAIPTTAFQPAWGVIFADNNALALVHQCSRTSPGPVQRTWTPTPQQIAELDEALFPALTVQLIQRELSDKGWQAGDYYRQYGGLVIAGQRVIYVNAFHRQVIEKSQQPDAWKSSPIGICDGGELAFGVEFDPETKTLAKFQFNGKL
jgi:hypothetical protein